MRKFYVGLFIALSLFVANNSSFAQLTGTKAIPGDYATIAAAVTDLNAQGVGAGGVVFNVAAGHTETSTIPVITATGTAANTIVFQKSGVGANPKITQATAGTVASSTTVGGNGDGIIIINGGDYITFDGIDLATGAAFTGTGLIEYGYFLKKESATNACKNVTIRNATITLSKTAIYSFGIFVSNISGTTSVTVTSTGGRSENIKIYNNTITNAYGGIQVRGFAATTPFDFYDQDISIGVDGPNTISNYGGGASTAYAIYALGQNNLKINNNVISGGDNTTTVHYGIFVTGSINSNIDVDNNTISIVNHSTTSIVAGISLQTGTTTGTTNTQNVRNNTITNISRPAVTSGATYFIYTTSNYPQNLVITGNQLGSSTLATTGAVYGIYQLSNPVNTFIENNTIHSISRTSTTSTALLAGINADNTTATTQTTISGNTIHTLAASGSSGIVTGINAGTQDQVNIFRNKIYNLSSDNAAGVVNGLTLTTGVEVYNVHNNIIGDLRAPSTSATTDAIRGISITSTTTTSDINLSYNSIYLNGTSTGANFSSSGVYHTTSTTATTATLHLINNIIVNKSVANGTGITSAFRRSSTSLTNYASNSNNNLFYAGIPSANSVIFYDGTNSDQTLAAYKARVSPIDNFSITEDVPFASTTGSSPGFLHINPAIATQVESGGTPVAGITVDFDGDTRNATTPDIGADELVATPADFLPPTITYSPFAASCGTGNRTLSVSIIDLSGVPTTGPLMPRIYYRKNNGTWFSQAGVLSSGTGNNGTWDFTIVAADMGGVVFSDVISYYIIAQDVVTTPNIVSSPTGAVATNVNTITTHPTTPEFYVVGASLNGTYTIGAAADIKTLSNAAAIYNGCPVTGPVVFSLVDATYSASEVFPISFEQNAGASVTNTLTIRPATGNAATITGSGTALIEMNGADHFVINGVNSGGSTLTIRNTSTTGPTLRFIADASNHLVQNSVIEGSVTSTTQGVIFIGAGTTSGNDNITIANNTIRDRSDAAGVPGNLIYSNAGSGTILNSNILVNANTLKNFTSTGINVAGTGATNSNENWTISGNEIFQEAARTTANTGIIFSNQGTGLITQNYIHDLNTSSTVTGITLNDSRNTTVSRNRIIQATVAGSTSTWTGINFTGNTTGDPTTTVVNNQISLIPTTSADQIIRGILDNSAADNTLNIYYNTVLIGGTGTAAGTDDTYAYIRESSVPSITDIKNNIFFNDRTGVAASHFAGGDQSMGTGVFTSNYNIWVGTGETTAANIMDRSASTTVTPMTFAAWQATTGTPDLNSLGSVAGAPGYTVAGLFVSATDLHAAATASAPSNAGTPIVSVTNDFDNDTRSLTTPDIGADEFTSTPPDNTPPVITYNQLADSCITGNRIIRATINDPGAGVPVTGALQPRIYYRKNAGTWFSSQGVLESGTTNDGLWAFTIVAADMGGLVATDVVQYYIIAQDAINNVGSNPAAGLVATDVNTVTTHPTSPADYLVEVTLNGTYTVGPGGNYTTLTAAIVDYNTVCVSGPVVFELTNANYSASETFPIVINQNPVASSVNTLTIRPAAGIGATITGASASAAIIDLNGADWVRIDGVNSGGSSLRIRNTSTTIPVIRFINDATNNIVTNTTIEGGVTSTTNGQILFSTSTGTTGNSNNAITNNIIRDRTDATAAAGVGVYASGTAAALNQDNNISGNHIFNFTSAGINLSVTGTGPNWTLNANHIYNSLTPSTTQTGITLAADTTGFVISNNFIGGSGPNATGTWTNSGNVTISGLSITNGDVAITNNTIANITSTNTGTSVRTRGINFTSSRGGSSIQGNTIRDLASFGGVTGFAGGSQAVTGIHYFPSGFQNLIVKGNTVYNISLENTAALTTSTIVPGMMLTNMGNTVSENKIYNIRNKSTGTTAGQPPIVAGLYIRFLTGNAINNMISIGEGENNNVQYAGILVAGGTATNTAVMNIYHNSVLVSGTSTGSNSSFAFLRGDNTATSALQTVTLRNNIFANTRSGGGSTNFAIGNQGTEASQLWSSNYNDLYSATPANVGLWNATAQTFANWQTTSAGDANSISVVPYFISPNDLHLVTGLNPAINNAGTPLTAVTTDFDNEPRSATTPDIGADEFTPSIAIDIQPLDLIQPIVATCYSNAETVKINIRNNSAATHDFNLFHVTVNASVTGPNPVTFAPVIINTGSLAPASLLEVTISTNYDMTASGTYTFNATTTVIGDVNTANDIMTPVVRTVTALAAGTVSTSHNAYCITGGTPTLTLTGSAGGTIQWQQSTASSTGPWVNVGTNSPTYTPASAITATTYYQAVVSCGTNSATSNVVTVLLNNPQVLTTTAASVCGSGTVTLQASGSAGATLNWYSTAVGGTTVGSGPSFTTPTLNATTTYYVSASQGGGGTANLGLTSTAGATSGAGTTNFGIVFDVFSPFTLQTVTIYPIATNPNTAGTVTIDVINSAGTVVHTATVNVIGNPVASAVGQTVNLNFNLLPGTNYKIRPGSRGPGITGLLFGPSAAAPPSGNYGYPFSIPGVVTLLHSTLTAAPTNTARLDLYYYFYNWVISTGCESARVPVVATVDPVTVGGTASANQSICVGATPSDIQLSGHTGSVVKWQRSSNLAFTSPVDIAVTSTTLTGAQIGPLNTTTYFRAVVQSGTCATENSSIVTITVANPIATIAYTNTPYCIAAGTATVTHTGSTGGTYSASPAGLTINPTTGAITLGTSTPGTYTVTYTIAASGACPLFTTTTTVAVSPSGTWLGVTSSNWNTASNWCGGIPTSTTDVVIPSTAPNMPNLSSATGTVRNLTINAGGSVIVGAGGRLDLYGNLAGAGTFTATAGHVAFMGASSQSTPALTALDITVNGAGWVPSGSSTITGTLTLTNGNITLGNNNLTLHNSSSGSAASHIIINGNGRVLIPSLAANASYVIPVATDATSYNPVWLVSNNGHVTDNFTIGIRDGVFVNGTSGAQFTTHVVDKTWLITEGTAGGSNVNVTLQWNGNQELTSFNRVKSYIMRHNGTVWVPGLEVPASGSNPYTQTSLNVSSFTSFAVQTQPIPRPTTNIYPNPTSSQLNVVIDLPAAQPVMITIHDAAGKLVMEKSVGGLTQGLNLHTLNVAHLSGGVYFIKVSISSNPEFILTKFVKQ